MKKIVSALAVLAFAISGFVMSAANATKPDPNHKDWVCKYVGKPGVDERFHHLIWIDTAATESGWFNDAHEKSFVLLADVPREPEPSATGCPGFETPEPPDPTPPVVTDPPVPLPSEDPDPRPWPNQPKNKPKSEVVIPTVVNAGV